MMNKKLAGLILIGAITLSDLSSVIAAKTITATVTAYTLDHKETGKQKSHKAYGITASGKKAIEGTTIAMSKKYKIGTKVKIEGFKWVFVVEDRGRAITDNRVDIFMNGKKQAINFGKKQLKITILE